MRRNECDVAIIGAGVAGLSAASRLHASGKDVVCLEATGRIGGRILTVHDPLAAIPIELGAEFVHGRPPETWDLIRQAGLVAFEHTPEAVHLERGRVVKQNRAGEIGDMMIAQFRKSRGARDQTFAEYLRRSRQPADLKQWAAVHIEGFNAARQDVVGIASLSSEAEAAEKIEGDRSFRILAGYDAIPLTLLHSIPDYNSVVHLNSMVEEVEWQRGAVQVRYRSMPGEEAMTLRCRRLIVTVSLGVLQTPGGSRGAITFDPEPTAILEAAATLQIGQVYRVTFRFREAFWESAEELKRAGFLISRDKGFFAWWTTHPIMSPLLTGWSAGTASDQFLKMDAAQIGVEATASLGRILNREVPRPEAVYFHDWHADPFFRGAYSYAPVNAFANRRELSRPVDGTLFFAGEAAEGNGHAATVHGAIASGLKAADLVLESFS